jgi:glycyl-tRNA synthetase alpha chain
MKPSPADIQDVYVRSLRSLGIALEDHDLRFDEDNWESPTIGAWGVGWQVLLDGLEITQFTYFQQCGGIDLAPVSVELTYGLERLAMVLQRVDNVYDMEWAPGVKYRDVRFRDEVEQSTYAFGRVDMPHAEFAAFHRDLFERHYAMCGRLLASGLVLPALEQCLKCSHLFNILDASGGIGVTERTAYILRVRQLAVGIARAYVAPGPAAGEAAAPARADASGSGTP